MLSSADKAARAAVVGEPVSLIARALWVNAFASAVAGDELGPLLFRDAIPALAGEL